MIHLLCWPCPVLWRCFMHSDRSDASAHRTRRLRFNVLHRRPPSSAAIILSSSSFVDKKIYTYAHFNWGNRHNKQFTESEICCNGRYSLTEGWMYGATIDRGLMYGASCSHPFDTTRVGSDSKFLDMMYQWWLRDPLGNIKQACTIDLINVENGRQSKCKYESKREQDGDEVELRWGYMIQLVDWNGKCVDIK